MTALAAPKNENGQALVELVLSVVILFLMIAGTLQISLLYIGRIQFDHACGIAAREFAFHDIDEDRDLERDIWENLGGLRGYFDEGSIHVTSTHPTSAFTIRKEGHPEERSFPDRIFGLAGGSKNPVLDYDGKKCRVLARFHPPLFFAVLYPSGIVFNDEFCVLRHPAGLR